MAVDRKAPILSKSAEAYAALALLSLIWGYTWIVIKVASFDASPFAIATLRVVFGAVCLFAVLAIRRDSLRPTPFVPTAIMGLLQTTGFTLLQTVAVAHGGAGKATILAYTMPFWTVLLAWPLLGERVAGLGWVSLACAAAGLAFVLAPFDPRAIIPDVLAIGAGLSWAASAVWAKLVRARYKLELLSLTTWQMVWGAVPMIVVTLLLPEHVRWTGSFIAAIAYMSLVGMALGWVIWMFVLHRLPAGVAGVASLAVPVVAVALAALQLHEIPSRTELIGMALIVAALVLNGLPRRAPDAPAPTAQRVVKA